MLDKVAELFIFGFVPMMAGAIATPNSSVAADRVLNGEVVYRERIALPQNAVLTVQLVDISQSDAPATVLGTQKIEQMGQVPVQFAIKFDPSLIQPRMTYTLQARITVDDEIWFFTTDHHPVDLTSGGLKTILLMKA